MSKEDKSFDLNDLAAAAAGINDKKDDEDSDEESHHGEHQDTLKSLRDVTRMPPTRARSSDIYRIPGGRGMPGVRRGIGRSRSTSGDPTGLRRSAGLRPGGRRMPPNRSVSSDGMPAMYRGMAINTPNHSLRRTDGPRQAPGRTASGMSYDSMASDADSFFSKDSVSIRKHQLVADPLEEGTYNDCDSFADHESVQDLWSVATDAYGDRFPDHISEYLPNGAVQYHVDLAGMGQSDSAGNLPLETGGGDQQSVSSGISGDGADFDFTGGDEDLTEENAEEKA